VAATIAFYATLIAGEHRVATDVTPGGLNWTRDIATGDVGAMLTPDWAVTSLRRYTPELARKLAMLPLPRFDPTDAPTATWGGTMIGIPRNARDPQASWALLKHLYLTPEAFEARQRYTDILPPTKSMWGDARYDAPDALYDGQRTARLFAELAEQVPARTVTPFSNFGASALRLVMNRAQRHVETHGEAGLAGNIERWLEEAEVALERRIAFGQFE
jgi:ABC-type glycerol-3-phosphate transport system substrate-binding protein